ncbi:3-deoxy-D-manno-octulosonic acid transferase [Desulfonatronum sp. SC1]|uniref:3-deoxy-D-manno-octulosonic acid transferase n=1 Tax=Desulfonatronum sp. SC1 TaxID=2109626 RepID=UPI000D3137A6|nr:glycosyltransferase N-terminal domain-containing protein [Desulfonatronum sp. SC1]PTN37749.1 3-deoxy-D-manno-octulosonic acid transferase [Desulfonatronum sp. SC1]
MLLLYRLLFPVALLAALPFYLPRMLRRGGYARHFGQRLGRVPNIPAPPAEASRIWIHAVSVGELQALGPLLELLLQEHPTTQIVMTTTTSTGYTLAERKYGQRLAYLGYFPVDFWPVSRRVWNRLQPDLCILMEGEIWPEHLHQARLRGVPTVLINARLSERSFRRWQALPRPLREPFAMLSLVVSASEEDGQRFARLGIAADRIVTSGNLKLDIAPDPILDSAELERLRADLGLGTVGNRADREDASRPLVLAGASTWPGEERMLLRVARKLANHGLPCKLLLIPRHAERRGELRDLLIKKVIAAHFRSTGSAEGPVDVAVADTTGEMVRLLQAADVVFVGKSMAPHKGGQNPIEAAALGRPVLFGPNMQNFQAVVDSLLAAKAGKVVRDEAELVDATTALLRDQAERRAMGQAARSWHQAGKGATRRTVDAISRFLGPRR